MGRMGRGGLLKVPAFLGCLIFLEGNQWSPVDEVDEPLVPLGLQ